MWQDNVQVSSEPCFLAHDDLECVPKMNTALLVGGMPLPPQLHRLNQGIQVSRHSSYVAR